MIGQIILMPENAKKVRKVEYVNVQFPKALVKPIDDLVEQQWGGFRTRTELIHHIVREWLRDNPQ